MTTNKGTGNTTVAGGMFGTGAEGKTNIRVCIGSACHLKGSYQVVHSLQKLVEKHGLAEEVEISAVFCLGHCVKAVSVMVNDGPVESVSPDTVDAFFKRVALAPKA